MKQAEVQHYRAMLQAQAVEPERRGLFGGPRRAIAAPHFVAPRDTHAPPPPRPGASRFGRRPAEAAVAAVETPLLLDQPAPPLPIRQRPRPAPEHHLAETPFHEEDLADPPQPSGPRPGVIAGWSTAKPPSAQRRLLQRVSCVIEAERHGLNARLAEAGV